MFTTRVLILYLFQLPIPVGLILDIPSKWHAGIYDRLALAHLQVTKLSQGSNVKVQLGCLSMLGKEIANGISQILPCAVAVPSEKCLGRPFVFLRLIPRRTGREAN